MKRIEWPGIATAVGILLVGAIALDLSKWQPLLAALVALGGGTLAYQGAMAKIYADQEKDRREFQRKRLGVFLRTEHACDHLAHRSNSLAEKTSRELKEKTVTLSDLKITDLSDLDEAWANLEMFPATVALSLSQIQGSVRTLDNFTEDLPEDTEWKFKFTTYTTQMKVTNDVAVTLKVACEAVLKELVPAIKHIAREMDDAESKLR